MPNKATGHAGVTSTGESEQTPDQRSLMSAYHREDDSILVIYDLSDPCQWTLAGQCVRCWGRERVEIHRLDGEHVAVEFKPGGARDLEGAA